MTLDENKATLFGSIEEPEPGSLPDRLVKAEQLASPVPGSRSALELSGEELAAAAAKEIAGTAATTTAKILEGTEHTGAQDNLSHQHPDNPDIAAATVLVDQSNCDKTNGGTPARPEEVVPGIEYDGTNYTVMSSGLSYDKLDQAVQARDDLEAQRKEEQAKFAREMGEALFGALQFASGAGMIASLSGGGVGLAEKAYTYKFFTGEMRPHDTPKNIILMQQLAPQGGLMATA